MRITLEDRNSTKEKESTPVKHESDYTKKEKWELEKKKIYEMPWKERLSYFWAYYRWVLAVAVIITVVISIVFSMVQNASKTEVFYLALTNAAGETEKMSEDLCAILSEGKKGDYVTIDNSFFMDEQGVLDYASTMSLTVKVAAMEIDAVIMPEKIFRNYETQEMFLPLTELMDNPKEKYGIKIEDNPVLKEYGFEWGEPVYIGVCANTTHPENAKKVLAFLGLSK